MKNSPFSLCSRPLGDAPNPQHSMPILSEKKSIRLFMSFCPCTGGLINRPTSPSHTLEKYVKRAQNMLYMAHLTLVE